MPKTRKNTGGHHATRNDAVARLLVVAPDDFARAVDAVRAAKRRTTASAERAPVRSWHAHGSV